MTYERFDVVVVPFPYTDRSVQKRRPAVILTAPSDYANLTGHAVMAMITRGQRSRWPFDVPLSDLSTAGLIKKCSIRLKLFSIDTKLVDRRIGALVAADREALRVALANLFGLRSLV